MADGTTTLLPGRKWSMPRLGSKVHTEERIGTRLNYRMLFSHLQTDKPELTEPTNTELLNRLASCNTLFKEVRTPREGLLDAVTLKTISSYARMQTIAIGSKATTVDAFKLMRKCAKLIRLAEIHNENDAFAEFYANFCPYLNTTGTMNLMSGRLPTCWFENRRIEKSFYTPRTRRVKEIIDSSQHTQIVQMRDMPADGEQTSKEIIRIHRCLEEAYEKNQNQPISFFMFTIHPTRFSRSVENIFHVSFLIKEGKAELFLDEDQLPVIRPLNRTATDASQAPASNPSDQIQTLTQLVLSLDMEQWETLVQVFHIQTAMIKD